MKFSKWLKNKLDEKGWKANQLSYYSGLSESEISRLLRGEREPSFKSTEKICQTLKIPLSGALHITGLLPKNLEVVEVNTELKKIPVISWVKANHFHHIEDPYPPGFGDDYIFLSAKGDKLIALKIVGDCMEPMFLEGEYIVVDPETFPESGDYAVFKDTESDEATFKQFKRYGDKIILHPLNPKHKDIELDGSPRYEAIGKVVYKYQKF